jgi:hypothetical protein
MANIYKKLWFNPASAFSRVKPLKDMLMAR